jgi:SPP1 family predicted phage head-tail adaptor
MTASKLDRIVRFERATYGDDGFGNVVTGWAPYGGPVWALRQDVSDRERFLAGQVQASITTRFQVRSTEFTRGITPADELLCEGQRFNITGITEAAKYGRRQLIEITAEARADGP